MIKLITSYLRRQAMQNIPRKPWRFLKDEVNDENRNDSVLFILLGSN